MHIRVVSCTLLILFGVALCGCDSVKTGVRDKGTGLAVDSVKMEFKDTMTLVLWGVPYARFTLELRVKTDATGSKTTDAVVTCRNVSDIPLKMTIDRVDHEWPGHLVDSGTEVYIMSPADLRACSYAKSLSVRVYHGEKDHEDADIGPERIAAIRKLYEKSFLAQVTSR